MQTEIERNKGRWASLSCHWFYRPQGMLSPPSTNLNSTLG